MPSNKPSTKATPAKATVSSAESLQAALTKDGYKAEVWHDKDLDQVYARVSKVDKAPDEFSGKEVETVIGIRLLSITPHEFENQSFYGEFKQRLGF